MGEDSNPTRFVERRLSHPSIVATQCVRRRQATTDQVFPVVFQGVVLRSKIGTRKNRLKQLAEFNPDSVPVIPKHVHLPDSIYVAQKKIRHEPAFLSVPYEVVMKNQLSMAYFGKRLFVVKQLAFKKKRCQRYCSAAMRDQLAADQKLQKFSTNCLTELSPEKCVTFN